MKIIYNYAKRELPAGFVRLDYIESTGTQWIDTGVKANQDTKADITLFPASAGSYSCAIGARTSSTEKRFDFIVGTAENAAWFGYGTASYQYNSSTITSKKRNFVNDKGNIYVDSIYISTITLLNDFTTPTTLKLFCNETSGTINQFFIGKFYSCKIYDNGTLVRNFIPCYRYSDGIEGLYDTVGKQFYANQGTGRFIRGKEIDSGNLLELKNFVRGYPSDTALANTTPRKFSLYNYVLGLTRTNYYYSDGTEISISEQTFTFTTTDGGRGVGFICDLKANTSYKIYCKSNTNDFALFAMYYGNNGTYITTDTVMSVGTQGVNTINFTTSSNMTQCVLLFRPSSGNPGSMTLSEISLHEVYN